MSALAIFLIFSTIISVALVAGIAGLVIVLKRAGVFSRMREDATTSLKNAASNAVDKIVK